MPLPISLVILSVIALVLHILFGYLIPNPPAPNVRAVISLIVIAVILLFWFIVPVHIG